MIVLIDRQEKAQAQSVRIGVGRRPDSSDPHVRLSSLSWKWKDDDKDRMLVWVVGRDSCRSRSLPGVRFSRLFRVARSH